MPELKRSDIPKPAWVQDSVSQVARRSVTITLYLARFILPAH
jgi:hypothetical protein